MIHQQPKIKIRKAVWDDMPKVARFIRASAHWYKKFIHQKDYSEHDVGFLWKTKNYKLRDFYIGSTSDNVEFGTISVQFFQDTTYIGYIFLELEHIGKGYGHLLIDHVKKLSLKRQQKRMVLLAHPKAKWAIKAYEKYGFKCILKDKQDVLSFQNGLLKQYYEEGFYLFEYDLTQDKNQEKQIENRRPMIT